MWFRCVQAAENGRLAGVLVGRKNSAQLFQISPFF